MAWTDILTSMTTLTAAVASIESNTSEKSTLALASADDVQKKLMAARLSIDALIVKAEQERERSAAEIEHDTRKEIMAAKDRKKTRENDKDGWPVRETYESALLGKRVVVVTEYKAWNGRTKPIAKVTKTVEDI